MISQNLTTTANQNTSSTTEKPIIAVFGSTGAQGGSVVRYLLQSDTTFKVRALTRDPNKHSAKQLLHLAQEWNVTDRLEIVECDSCNYQSMMNALTGCYGVFGVTNYYDEETQSYEGGEFGVGKNMVEAVFNSNVKHFIFSALDDVYSKIMQYALQKENPKGINLSFVFMGCYLQNWMWPKFFPFKSEGTNTVSMRHILRLETQLPWIDITQCGSIVLQHFKHPEIYNNGKVTRVASEYRSFGDCLQLFEQYSKGIKIHYTQLSHEEGLKEFGEDYTDMMECFNEIGYFPMNPPLQEANHLNPNLHTFRQFFEKIGMGWLQEIANKPLLGTAE
ncbi:hypothetical protein ABK040_015015 [Willaertia magna]